MSLSNFQSINKLIKKKFNRKQKLYWITLGQHVRTDERCKTTENCFALCWYGGIERRKRFFQFAFLLDNCGEVATCKRNVKLNNKHGSSTRRRVFVVIGLSHTILVRCEWPFICSIKFKHNLLILYQEVIYLMRFYSYEFSSSSSSSYAEYKKYLELYLVTKKKYQSL